MGNSIIFAVRDRKIAHSSDKVNNPAFSHFYKGLTIKNGIMKTNQVMKRQMGVFAVYQRTNDGFFNATDLLKQWNESRPDKKRELDNFWKSTNLSELMSEIAENELNITSVDFTVLKKTLSKASKARFDRGGGTWMHPILFIKFAMYLDTRFEYHVLKFVSDQMLQYRNEAGEAYKVLAKAVSNLVGDSNLPKFLPNIAKAINHIVFGEHSTMIRNEYGSEKKQRELWALERKLADLVEDGFITTYDQMIDYLRKKWINKYQPKVLR